MKNLNVPEKSKGVVVFAWNTATVDYVRIANQAARLIHQTLNLPVTLITDQPHTYTNIDQTIIVANNHSNVRKGYANLTAWRNGDRYRAYELSPYDQTLLLDSDYLQLDCSLSKLFEVTTDYQIMVDNQFISAAHNPLMGPISLPMAWATAVVFKKTPKARQLFDLVGRVQRNYDYYRKLYHIQATNFRNDYAFAIANNIINGYTLDQQHCIPQTMLTIDGLIKNIEINNNKLIVRTSDTAHILPRQNIHVIDKDYLLSDNFNNFVEELCRT